MCVPYSFDAFYVSQWSSFILFLSLCSLLGILFIFFIRLCLLRSLFLCIPLSLCLCLSLSSCSSLISSNQHFFVRLPSLHAAFKSNPFLDQRQQAVITFAHIDRCALPSWFTPSPGPSRRAEPLNLCPDHSVTCALKLLTSSLTILRARASDTRHIPERHRRELLVSLAI